MGVVPMSPLLPEAWPEVLLALAFWAALVAVIVVAVIGLSRRHQRRAYHPPHAIPQGTVVDQLTWADDLLAQGRISPSDHAAMRATIQDLR